MNDIIVSGTDKLPSVNLDAHEGLVEFFGRSIPEDGKGFYEDILKWVRNYALTPTPQTTLNIGLEYLNSSSQLYLQRMFTVFNEIHQQGKSKVKAEWKVEEDDSAMRETAEVFKQQAEFDFSIKVIDQL